MLLLENQLPFSVLEQLWILTGRGKCTLRRSVLKFFRNLLPEEHDLEPPPREVYHILHLLHSSLRVTPDPSKDGLRMQTSAYIDPHDRRGSPELDGMAYIDPHDRQGSPELEVMAYIDPHDRRGSPMSEPKPLPPKMEYIDPHDRQGSPELEVMAYIDPHDRRGSPELKEMAYIDPHDRQGSPELEVMAYIDPQERRSPMSEHKPPPPPKTIPTVTELQEAGTFFAVFAYFRPPQS
ncbi:hypothetical protein AAC387_Pa02g0141 [Persea americana]